MVAEILGEALPEEIWETIAKETQKLRIKVEKRRWGKIVTIVEGLDRSIDGEKIAKQLKKRLACGGTFKNGRIELQGDHRSRIKKVLTELGFNEESIEIV